MQTIRVQMMRRRTYSSQGAEGTRPHSIAFRDLEVVRAKEFHRGGRHEGSVHRFNDCKGERL